MDPLDPELAEVIDAVEGVGVPEWHTLSVGSARQLEEEVFTATGDHPPMDFVRTVAFDASAGEEVVRGDAPAGEVSVRGDAPAGEVGVRFYRRADEAPVPVLVFYHGGGWTLGTLDSIDGVCRHLAARTGCLVASVDYRLAPEYPFPTPLDDAYAALEWVADTAPAFDGDPSRLAVAGTSAGGNLAAAVARRSRRENGPTVDRQVLCYPMVTPALDAETRAGVSIERVDDGPLLSGADVNWFWNNYLRSPVDAANPYADLLAATDYDALPPATVVTAGHDPLAAEGAVYADALADAGVPVEHRHYSTMSHGFLSLTEDVGIADDALHEVAHDIVGTWRGGE